MIKIFFCYRRWIVGIGLLSIFLADLYLSKVILWPFQFQIETTIFANKHIEEAILQHQQDALYLPFRLRPFLFNSLIYLYYLLTHLVSFLSISNIQQMVLLANLYPLSLGFSRLLKHSLSEKLFIMGSLGITFFWIGFSRAIPEASFLVIVSPIFIYLLLLGLGRINLKIYLTLLTLSLLLRLKF